MVAEQVPTIPNEMLVLCVGVGVGIFLSITLIRSKKEHILVSKFWFGCLIIILNTSAASRVLTELLTHNTNNGNEKANGIITSISTEKAYKI